MSLARVAARAAARGLRAGAAARAAGAGAPALALAAAAPAGERAYATVLEGLKYAESHEWVKVEGDTATIGISDFAQEELGDVVYVELPEEGAEFEKGDSFATIESVKAASDVYMPVSGTVVTVNSSLADEPSKVNEDSYAEGWLVKLKLANPAEVEEMMDAAAYTASTES